MIEHLFHNDHGEWSFIAMFLGSLGVLWGIFKARLHMLWRKITGDEVPLRCEVTSLCCEHDRPLGGFNESGAPPAESHTCSVEKKEPGSREKQNLYTEQEMQIVLSVARDLFRTVDMQHRGEGHGPLDLFACGCLGLVEETRPVMKSVLERAHLDWRLERNQ